MHNNHKVHAQVHKRLRKGRAVKNHCCFPSQTQDTWPPLCTASSHHHGLIVYLEYILYYATAKRAQKVEPCSYNALARYEELCALHYLHYPQKQHRTSAEQEKAGGAPQKGN